MRFCTRILASVSVLALAACSSGNVATAPSDKMDYEVKGVSLSMVEVPSGAFTKGVTVSGRGVEGVDVSFETFEGYAISREPISSELWCAVMGGSPEAGYAQKMTRKDAEKFASKLSSLTGQNFSIPTESQLEYAMRYGFGNFDKKFREWVSSEGSDKDIARSSDSRSELAPGTKAGMLGFRVVFPTGKPCPQPILDAISGKVAREQGEKKSEYIEVAGQVFLMIGVPGGTFKMGGTEKDQGQYAKEDELPVHEVTVDDFEIGETEVTVALWNAVMGSVPAGNDPVKGAAKPVVNISWYDAQLFVARLCELTGRSFRLPTEAEWEYAARDGMSEAYRYSGSNNVDQAAVYGDEKGGGVKDVKSKGKSVLGIADMSGNAWEWCQDWYGPYSSEASTNPTGPSEGSDKVLRGGSVSSRWNACRVSNRSSVPPVNVKSTFGMRLAL